eukprot:6462110-Pyramimonas_sp.AAC.1
MVPAEENAHIRAVPVGDTADRHTHRPGSNRRPIAGPGPGGPTLTLASPTEPTRIGIAAPTVASERSEPIGS